MPRTSLATSRPSRCRAVTADKVSVEPLTTSFVLVGPWDPMERTLMQAILPLAVPLAWRLADFGRRQMGQRPGTPPTHAHLIIGRWRGRPETDASYFWAGPTVVVELDRVMPLQHRRTWPLRLVGFLAHEFLHLRQMGRAPSRLLRTLAHMTPDAVGPGGRPPAAGQSLQLSYEDAWIEQEAAWLDSRTARAFGLRVPRSSLALYPFVPDEMAAWQPLVSHYRGAASVFGPPLDARHLPHHEGGGLSPDLLGVLQELWPSVTGRAWPSRISAANREHLALVVGDVIHDWLDGEMGPQPASVWLGHRRVQRRLQRALPGLVRHALGLAQREQALSSWRPLHAAPLGRASRWDLLLQIGLAETWAAALAGRLPIVRTETLGAPLLHATRRTR